MALFKSISEKIRLMFMLAIVCAILYGSAWAVINRIVGVDFWDGEGIILRGASSGKDSIHVKEGRGLKIDTDSVVVLPGWGLKFAGDSVRADEAFLDDYFVTLSTAQDVSGRKNFTDTLGTGAGGTDGLLKIYSEQGATDYWILFKPNAAMTQTVTYVLPADDGTASQFLQSDGAGNLTWATPSGAGDITDVYNVASGDANQLTIGESEFLAGGAVDGTTDPYVSLPQGADVSTVVGEGRISWDTDGDRLYVGNATVALWHLKETDIDASAELLAIMDDETGTGALVFGTSPTFTTGVNLPANAVDAETEIAASMINESHLKAVDAAVDENILTYESTTGDFEWHTAAEVAGAAINDSLWNPTALPQNGRLSISEATDDSVSIIYPLSVATIEWAVKHINESGAAANQLDTVVFSLRLPTGVPDVDSITFNIRTSSADTNTSGLRVRCFKQTAELGSLTALTATLIGYFSATDVWVHKTIAGADIGAVAGGNILWILMCVQTDAAAIVWHDEPKVWCINKQ